jgi:hypothetical protein
LLLFSFQGSSAPSKTVPPPAGSATPSRGAEQHNLLNATQLVNTFFTPGTAFPSPQNSSPDTAKHLSWLRKGQLLQITSHPSHQDRGKLLDPQQTVKGKITAGVKNPLLEKKENQKRGARNFSSAINLELLRRGG